jgi:hypothetical protein
MNRGAIRRGMVDALSINFYWRHKILSALNDGTSNAVLKELRKPRKPSYIWNAKGDKNAGNTCLLTTAPPTGPLITRVLGNPDKGGHAAVQKD